MEEIIKNNPRVLLYATVALIFMCAIGALLIMFTLTLVFTPPASEEANTVFRLAVTHSDAQL